MFTLLKKRVSLLLFSRLACLPYGFLSNVHAFVFQSCQLSFLQLNTKMSFREKISWTFDNTANRSLFAFVTLVVTTHVVREPGRIVLSNDSVSVYTDRI